jgi:hypothetical protein
MGSRVAPKKLNGRPKRKNSELGNIYIYIYIYMRKKKGLEENKNY